MLGWGAGCVKALIPALFSLRRTGRLFYEGDWQCLEVRGRRGPGCTVEMDAHGLRGQPCRGGLLPSHSCEALVT
jgi:hypothetical protein